MPTGQLNYPNGTFISCSPANTLTWQNTAPNYYSFWAPNAKDGQRVTITIKASL